MTTADHNFLEKLNAVINKRIHENNLSSTILADDFCLSPRHFNRKVKSITGLNTILYIRKRRIERACILLRDTDLPVSQIYVKCGIESANYFSRIFKMETGITPTEYRNQHNDNF